MVPSLDPRIQQEVSLPTQQQQPPPHKTEHASSKTATCLPRRLHHSQQQTLQSLRHSPATSLIHCTYSLRMTRYHHQALTIPAQLPPATAQARPRLASPS